jgi:hypothetical protein
LKDLNCQWQLSCKCIVAVLASEVLAATPVILYPVEFAVKLGIKEEDMPRILNNLL